jgi:hypothetical protein
MRRERSDVQCKIVKQSKELQTKSKNLAKFATEMNSNRTNWKISKKRESDGIRSQMSSKSESSLASFRSAWPATSANAEKLSDDKSEDEISKKCDAAKETSLPRSSPKSSSYFIHSTTFEHETSPPDETTRNL